MLSIVGNKEAAGRGVRLVARVELLIDLDFRELLLFAYNGIGADGLDNMWKCLELVIVCCLGLQLDWKKGALPG